MVRKLFPFAVLVLGAVLLSVVVAGVGAQGPQPRTPQVVSGPGFSYQGQLKQGGSAVTAACDMAFGLYDAASSGARLGTAITTTVPVTAGVFTVVLNSGGEFGANAFNGDARWLDIQVRCPSGVGSFTTLAPRQALTAAPYALYASGNWGLGGNANTAPGTNFIGTRDNQPLVLRTNNNEAMRIDSTGNVGIGTTTPANRLTVTGGDVSVERLVLGSEGFEGGTFPPAGWTTGGSANWTRTTSVFYQGSASAASGDVSSFQTSFLTTSVTFPAAGIVRFFWRLESGGNLVFCLDNDACTGSGGYYARISGSVDWTEVVVPVSAGAHNFRWAYQRGPIALGLEKGWIDGVQIYAGGGNLHVKADADFLGRVGIGTISPSQQLQVDYGNILVKGNNNFRRNGDTAYLYFGDTNHYIRGEAGFGVHIGTYGIGDAINIQQTTGNVGIGMANPGYRLQLPNVADATGQGQANAWQTYSSRRFKSNVATIENALDKVQQLRGVTFDWTSNGKHDIGVIAEEVGQVIPEIVSYEANGVDAQSLDYSRLVAVLIEATKAQQQQIAQQQQTIDTLQRDTGTQLAEVKQQNAALEARLSALEQNLQTKSAPAAANHAELNLLADLTSGSNLLAATLLGIVVTCLVRGRKNRGT